jgi:hypothetical protein
VTTLPFCACGCGRRVPNEHRIHGWRSDCLAELGDEYRHLQDMSPEDLGMLVAFLRDRGRNRLANIAVGCIPFDRPSREELERLAYE